LRVTGILTQCEMKTGWDYQLFKYNNQDTWEPCRGFKNVNFLREQCIHFQTAQERAHCIDPTKY